MSVPDAINALDDETSDKIKVVTFLKNWRCVIYSKMETKGCYGKDWKGKLKKNVPLLVDTPCEQKENNACEVGAYCRLFQTTSLPLD